MPSKRKIPVVQVTRQLRQRTGKAVNAGSFAIVKNAKKSIKTEELAPISPRVSDLENLVSPSKSFTPLTEPVTPDAPKVKVEISEEVEVEANQVKLETKSKYFEKFDQDAFIAQMDTAILKVKAEIKKEEQEDVKVAETSKTLFVEQTETIEKMKVESIESSPAKVSKRSGFPTNWFPPALPSDFSEKHPKNWQKIYNSVVEMRKLIVTPVDSMGCERMPDTITPQLSQDDAKLYRFQLLISLMLSAQTKDETNFLAMTRLTNHFKEKGFGGLCLEACLAATEAEIDECVKQVGFHRRKAHFIKKTCEIIKDTFDGDIPKTIEEIVTFPGVGPKMGHLLLQNGWGVNLGIGIDVHLHRLAQMWGWAPKSDKPEKTRMALEDWLPKKYWADINPLLVGFGQTVCAPRASNCDICHLASAGLCKGVNRKLARTELNEKRILKLQKLRGDLTKLIEMKLAEALKM